MEEHEVMFHKIIENDIKTEIVKQEPKEADFSIREICNENSDNGEVCVHQQNHRLNVEQRQDNILQHSSSVNNLQTMGDVRTEIENTNCSSSRGQEDFITKLINSDIAIKVEEYLDTPEYFLMNIDFVESRTGQVKTENEDDIFCESRKIAKFKEEPTENETTLSSNMLVQDEISIEDVKCDFSEESQEGFKRRIQTNHNKLPRVIVGMLQKSHIGAHSVQKHFQGMPNWLFTKGVTLGKNHSSATFVRNRSLLNIIWQHTRKPIQETYASSARFVRNAVLVPPIS